MKRVAYGMGFMIGMALAMVCYGRNDLGWASIIPGEFVRDVYRCFFIL